MKYQSTRDNLKNKIESAQAIKQGLANDGGLFVPDAIPALSFDDIKALCPLSYPERAANILSRYLTDYTYDELLEDCKQAYCECSFPGGAAPLNKVTDTIYSLELWHGPTCAFKDLALQLLPYLLTTSAKKVFLNEKVQILTTFYRNVCLSDTNYCKIYVCCMFTRYN